MKTMTQTAIAILMAFGSAVSAHGTELPHRDDFAMNSISGGEFRRYVMAHVEGDDAWAQSMRSFGVFHNLMHEWMSGFARYGRKLDADSVPSFQTRISGGQWSDYRARLESGNSRSPWQDFVQITEIMHDRVHQAMYKAVVLDARSRDANVTDFADSDRAPHASEDTFPDNGPPGLEMMSADDFRQLAWTADLEDPNLNGAVQQLAAFGEMLDDLLTAWTIHGASLDDRACRLDHAGGRVNGDQWRSHIAALQNCEEKDWTNLVHAASLMHDRIRHAMFQLALYLEASGRSKASTSR